MHPSGGDSRPRTIITADPELDDLNSMIRLLLYSNEIEIAGLIYASSRFHWRGDGRGTPFYLPDREYDEPQSSWRWSAGERFIEDAIDAYASDHPRLRVHDARYPHPDQLRDVVREGNVDFEGDTSRDTPGSDLIAQVLLDDRDDPVHLQLWAGPSTVTRALMSIEERFSAHERWEQMRDRVSRKAVITKFASQDSSYDTYIRVRWPNIRVVDVASYAWGYFARRVVRVADAHLLSAEWTARHVTQTGALGALYRVWGDGRQMVPGDPTDFFHLHGYTRNELVEMGYQVWMEPCPAGEWISEGDTPNMLNLIVPSLRGHEHPSYGGWGGRAVRTDEGVDTWKVRDVDDDLADSRGESSLTRWFADAQADFAARLQWSARSTYAEANHHPELRVHEGTNLEAPPGSRVHLTALASDPDGDDVHIRWAEYREASTTLSASRLEAVGAAAVVEVPPAARAGERIHVIVEARDDAEFPLVAYQRVIITVTG